MKPLFIVLVALFLVWFIRTYNQIVARKNAVNNAFASVDAMLKRRCDLIPRLVEVVRAYARHENEVLSSVTELRERALKQRLTARETIDLEKQLDGALGEISILVEAYPELKTSEQFLQLQRSLNVAEGHIAAARRTFNAAVTAFNTFVETIPSNLVATLTRNRSRRLFEILDRERVVPRVRL